MGNWQGRGITAHLTLDLAVRALNRMEVEEEGLRGRREAGRGTRERSQNAIHKINIHPEVMAVGWLWRRMREHLVYAVIIAFLGTRIFLAPHPTKIWRVEAAYRINASTTSTSSPLNRICRFVLFSIRQLSIFA
jgi:hypothetical protein